MRRHPLQIHNSTNVYNSYVYILTMRYPRAFRCLSNSNRGTLGFSGENAAGEKCSGVRREISTRHAGFTVSWQHPSRTSLTPRYTANVLARKERKRMYRDDEEAQSVAAPSKGESATRSSSYPARCLRLLLAILSEGR